VTETDEMPGIDLKNKEGINLAEWGVQNNYDVCLHATGGSFSYDIIWPDTFTEEQIEDLNRQIDETGSHFDVLESKGYRIVDLEYWLSGPLEIEDESGNVIATGCEGGVYPPE